MSAALLPAHARGCVRADWLLARPKLGLFWTVLFQEGPACDCSALNTPRGVTQGAQVPPCGVNTEVGGASPT